MFGRESVLDINVEFNRGGQAARAQEATEPEVPRIPVAVNGPRFKIVQGQVVKVGPQQSLLETLR